MEILNKILEDKHNRVNLIKQFQELVWNDYSANEVLADLAYDLDFYEPNSEWRKEDLSYYGDERLEKEVRSAIEKLKC